MAGVGLKIFCGAKDLDRKDAGGLGKSVIYPDLGRYYNKDDPRPIPFYKTEIIANNLNPRWDPIFLYYDLIGGTNPKLFIECYDYDSDGSFDLIGEFRCTLSEFANKRSNKFVFFHPRKKSPFYRHSGHYICHDSEVLTTKDPKFMPCIGYTISFGANSLERKDLLSSDPFLVVKSRVADSVQGITNQMNQVTIGYPGQQTNTAPRYTSCAPRSIAKTETIPSNLNPRWRPIQIDVDEVGGLDTKFTLEVWDADANKDELIGEAHITLRECLWSKPQFTLLNPAKVGNALYYNSGVAEVFNITKCDTPKKKGMAYKIKVKCTKLARKDITGTSDPFFVLKAFPPAELSFPYSVNPKAEIAARGSHFKHGQVKAKIYQSEMYRKNLNPEFKEFTLNVLDCGSLDSKLEVKVYDWDERGKNDLIGVANTTLRDFVMPNALLHLTNHKATFKAGGNFHVVSAAPCDPTFNVSPYAYEVEIHATKIERMDLGGLGKSDPFLIFVAQPYTHMKPIRIHQTEIVRSTTNCFFKPFLMELAKFGGLDSPIKIECWDHDDGKSPDYIGGVTTSMRELSVFWKTEQRPQLKLINPRKRGRIGYTDSGLLAFVKFEPRDPPPQYVAPQQFQAISFQLPPGITETMLQTVTVTTTTNPPGVPGYGPPPGQPYATTPNPGFGAPPQPGYGNSYPQPSPYATAPPTANSFGQPPPNAYPQGPPQGNPYATAPPTPYGQPPPGGNPYGGNPYDQGNPYGTGVPQGNPYATAPPPGGNPYDQGNPYGTGVPQGNPYATAPPPGGNPYGGNPYDQGNPYGTGVPQGNPYATGPQGYPGQPGMNPYATGAPSPYDQQQFGYGQPPAY